MMIIIGLVIALIISILLNVFGAGFLGGYFGPKKEWLVVGQTQQGLAQQAAANMQVSNWGLPGGYGI